MRGFWRVGITAAILAAAPAAATAQAADGAPARDTAVVAGGCFWGVQAVFEHVRGVTQAMSGYAGGERATAEYETVSTGTTGHAESVRIVFDPAVVSYATLLKVYFAVAHDPTELNRQGPDAGTQYRSNIFYLNADQHRVADSVITALTRAHAYPRPIVTLVTPLHGFFPAEAYHQDYALIHPDDPYIYFNDRPKVAHLKQQFPQLWQEDPVRVLASR